jgi:hypothetical protein
VTDSPFLIDVYTKSFEWVGRITDPVSINGSVRHNALSNFQFRLRAGDPMIEDVLRKGCRITMQYRGVGLVSGMVRTKQGDLLPNGDVVFQLQGDWRILPNTTAVVAPAHPLTPTALTATIPAGWGQTWLPGGGADAGPDGTTQGQYGYYLWPDGSAASAGVYVAYAESAVKNLIDVNALKRLGRPITIAPDLQRGGDARAAGVLPNVRMSKLEDAVRPLLAWSGLGLRVMQEAMGKTINVEVYEPSEWGAPLTVASGVVEDGGWSLNPPIATRVIVGGPGELADRAFWGSVDAGLEGEYGDIIEVFRDATGAGLKWPDALAEVYRVAKYYLLRPEVSFPDRVTFTNYLNAAAAVGLLDGVPTAGVQASLSESETFYFGGTDGVQLGDRVTIKTGEGASVQEFTDIITEAKFSLSSTGFEVEPILGIKSDDPNRALADAVATLAASQRRLSTSR